MIWESISLSHFVLETKVVILEHVTKGVRERALSLFVGKAQRTINLAGEVAVLITTSQRLRDLNRTYRHKNVPTDVLSFPSDNPRLAGDISISAEIAAANAAQLGHSVETELRILILHGLLHLAGYDHENDNGEMRTLEERLRQRFDLPSSLIARVDGAAAHSAADRKSADRHRNGKLDPKPATRGGTRPKKRSKGRLSSRGNIGGPKR
jgi:probable rRNA maturation factor